MMSYVKENIVRSVIFLLLLSVTAGLLFPLIVNAEIIILGTRINCDPGKIPSAGGCGFSHFLDMIRAFINFLVRIAIPLAAVFIAWGGIIIMSASGSTERVATGKKVITAAVIGIVIILAAWLIVGTIYLILPIGGVGKSIKDALFGNRI